MKKLILILATAFVLGTAVFFCACGDDKPSSSSSGTGTVQPDKPDKEPDLLSFTGISLNDKTVTYDGTEHELKINGTVPEGTKVEYTDNKGTNAGVYNATAKLTKDGYNPLTLTAKFTINKATFTGITFVDGTFVATGSAHTIEITGELPEPEITKVTYTNNSASQAGEYKAKATITNPNYETLTLNAVLTVKSLANVAADVLNMLLDKPDPWSFLPETFSQENMAYTALPVNDFTSFVNVSSIGYKIIGKQFNVLYEGLTDTATLLGYIDNVTSVGATIASLYQTYINNNPDDYAQFSGEAGGFKFRITLDGEKSELLAGNSTVSLELTYDKDTQLRTGRIQLSSGMVLRYQSGADYMKLAVEATIAGVGNLKQIEFARTNGTVAGYLYEYTGTENNNLKTSAVITSNTTKTMITSNKRETDDLKTNYYEEVYDSKTGKYIGGEVNETVSSVEYNTLWFMLDDVSGFNTVKVETDQNKLNADTVYLNGSSTAISTKSVGITGGLKATSRRYDIEMKDVRYVVATTEDGKTKYDTVKCSVPMLFVQVEQTSTFGADFKEKNEYMATTPALPSFTAVTQDYEMNAELFITIKENVAYSDIITYLGSKNPYFS